MRKSWQKVAVRLACVLGVSCLALTGMPDMVWAAAAPYNGLGNLDTF